MAALGGTLVIDGREAQIAGAACRLFIGRLDVDYWSDSTSGACHSIPFGDAVEFAELPGCTVSIPDCQNFNYDNSLFTPLFVFAHEYYTVRSLKVDSISFNQKDNVLSFALQLTASEHESDREIVVEGQMTAECRGIDCIQLLLASCPIPIRFANHYLPLLDIPMIPAYATRSQIVSLFGMPNADGGGQHPIVGDVPEWIRYTLPSCFLHFQFDSKIAQQVSLMPREEWLEKQGLGSLKDHYCSPWVR